MDCEICRKNSMTDKHGLIKSVFWVSEINKYVCNVCIKYIDIDEKVELQKIETVVNQWREKMDLFGISYFHYMTHIDNVESILESGILSYNRVCKNRLPHKRIDSEGVQWRRARKTISGFNGTLHDYVPLYFCTKTAMQWVVCSHNNLNKKGISPNNLVFIDVNRSLLSFDGVYFTDGNAADDLTKFYYDLEDLNKLNWESMHLIPKKFKFDKEWQRQRMAEILVRDVVPVEAIERIVCFSSEIQGQLVNIVNKYTDCIDVCTDDVKLIKVNNYYKTEPTYYFDEDLSSA